MMSIERKMKTRILAAVIFLVVLAFSAQGLSQTVEPASLKEIQEELKRFQRQLDELKKAGPRQGEKAAAIMRGASVYRKACLPCHGVKGDGQGLGAEVLDPKPRDFTRGEYKFRTTESGSIPTDSDLFRTITEGIPGTAMPAWGKLLSEAERRDVVQYIKTFSSRFEEEAPEEPIVIGKEPPVTPAGIERGKRLYKLYKCWECHGEKGLGDGPSAKTLKDDQGRQIKAYDFTRGDYKGGGTGKDIYRTFNTGLTGTPMPSYADSIPKEKDRWDLVHYVKSLERKKGILFYLLRAPLWDEPMSRR